MNEPWVGFDLDDTLATYLHVIDFVGSPVMPMIEKLKRYLNAGYKCKIFTARACMGQEQTKIIHKWLEEQGLPKLEVTNCKDFGMMLLYDDRCVAVDSGTGIVLGGNEIIK